MQCLCEKPWKKCYCTHMTNNRNSRRKSRRRVSLTFHYRAEIENVEMTREYSRHWVSAQKLRTTASWTWAAWPACALCGNDEHIIWENAKSARKPPVTAHPSDRPALPGQRAGAGVSAKTQFRRQQPLHLCAPENKRACFIKRLWIPEKFVNFIFGLNWKPHSTEITG